MRRIEANVEAAGTPPRSSEGTARVELSAYFLLGVEKAASRVFRILRAICACFMLNTSELVLVRSTVNFKLALSGPARLQYFYTSQTLPTGSLS